MTTATDLISLALRTSGVLGVGQAADPQDLADGFTILNQILSQWSRKRYLVYALIDVSAPMTGVQSYSIGPGGAFNTARPDRLEGAYLRITYSQPGIPVDYPLTIIQSREDYSRFAVKTLGTMPSAVWYDAAYPVGNVYPYPVPIAGLYELHLLLKQPLTAFASLTAPVVLPPEYEPALLYNLCVRIRPAYGMGPDPTITALARDSLDTLRQANAQIPKLQLPSDFPKHGGWYSVFADRLL